MTTMTRREAAINEAIRKMTGTGFAVWRVVLSDLIDQAEAGRLKEPLPVTYVGASGSLTVHPNGRREHRP